MTSKALATGRQAVENTGIHERIECQARLHSGFPTICGSEFGCCCPSPVEDGPGSQAATPRRSQGSDRNDLRAAYWHPVARDARQAGLRLRDDRLRRLKQWHRNEVFQKLYEMLLAERNGADKSDWSRALVDSATTKAPSGGEKTGPNPTDRRKLGSKVPVLVDAKGIPLAITVTGAHPPVSE